MTWQTLLFMNLLLFSKVLHNLIVEIVVKKVDDVRDALRKFRDQMLEQIAKGITNPKLTLD
jgi:CTD small phosphatase-like protein 2